MVRKSAPPPDRPERAIVLISGESSTGKSFFIANLKNALIFDTDLGGGLAAYQARIERNGSRRVEVGSYLDIMEAMSKENLGDFNTVAIDQLTSVNQEAVIRHNPKFLKDFGAGNEKAAKEWRKVREMVRWRDFHLFATAHPKSKWEDEKIVGTTTDAAKGLERDFHVVLYLQGNAPGTTAIRQKWRRDPEDARGRVPDRFPFTMEKFIEIRGESLEGKRDEETRATPEQIALLHGWLNTVKLPEGTSPEKWLAKAGADDWPEVSQSVIEKCITYCADLAAKAAKTESKNGPETKADQ